MSAMTAHTNKMSMMGTTLTNFGVVIPSERSQSVAGKDQKSNITVRSTVNFNNKTHTLHMFPLDHKLNRQPYKS